MKIRTDFVTNSSSSSFTVEVSIRFKNGYVQIEEDPGRRNPDGNGEASFDADLRDINEHLSSVEELATWLAKSIRRGYDKPLSKNKRDKFINEAVNKIKSVRDIKTVTVERRYFAWGEFADLVADSSPRLNELAKKYLQSTGIEKKRAEAEMITYIHTATDAKGMEFGRDCVINKYSWDGRSVDELAERLCSNEGPESVRGTERKMINLKTGEYFSESSFSLS